VSAEVVVHFVWSVALATPFSLALWTREWWSWLWLAEAVDETFVWKLGDTRAAAAQTPPWLRFQSAQQQETAMLTQNPLMVVVEVTATAASPHYLG